MRLACLFSGGKDSTYAAHLMEQSGHEVACLVTILPSDPHSMVFHTLNLEHLPVMAQAMGLDLVAVPSSGEEASDLEALAAALSALEGVVTGAIASDYQWDRINGVCDRLGLKVFSPLWRKDQPTLLKDAPGRDEGHDRRRVLGRPGCAWLGRILDERALNELTSIAEREGDERLRGGRRV